MRRILAVVFACTFLALPARAAYDSKYVALTFDDGPSGKYTRALLDGLYDRGVHATFLLCGYRMADYPEITQRIFEEGHEIGLHGYSHKKMVQMSRRAIAQELMDCQPLLPEGCQPVLFRPPGGQCSDSVLQVAQARNLAVLSWSVDPQDWATDSVAAIEKAVLQNVRDGDIVLLHDMSHSSVQAALDIVDVLLKENYEFVTVSQLARIRGQKLHGGQVYTCFPKKEETMK